MFASGRDSSLTESGSALDARRTLFAIRPAAAAAARTPRTTHHIGTVLCDGTAGAISRATSVPGAASWPAAGRCPVTVPVGAVDGVILSDRATNPAARSAFDACDSLASDNVGNRPQHRDRRSGVLDGRTRSLSGQLRGGRFGDHGRGDSRHRSWRHRSWRHRGWRHRGWRHRGWRHRGWCGLGRRCLGWRSLGRPCMGRRHRRLCHWRRRHGRRRHRRRRHRQSAPAVPASPAGAEAVAVATALRPTPERPCRPARPSGCGLLGDDCARSGVKLTIEHFPETEACLQQRVFGMLPSEPAQVGDGARRRPVGDPDPHSGAALNRRVHDGLLFHDEAGLQARELAPDLAECQAHVLERAASTVRVLPFQRWNVDKWPRYRDCHVNLRTALGSAVRKRVRPSTVSAIRSLFWVDTWPSRESPLLQRTPRYSQVDGLEIRARRTSPAPPRREDRRASRTGHGSRASTSA